MQYNLRKIKREKKKKKKEKVKLNPDHTYNSEEIKKEAVWEGPFLMFLCMPHVLSNIHDE